MLSISENLKYELTQNYFRQEKNGGEEWGKHCNQFQKFLRTGQGEIKSILDVCHMQGEKL